MSDESPDPTAGEPGPARPARKTAARLKRSAARLAAVQALYQMEMTGVSLGTATLEFESRWIGAEIEGAQYLEADLALFRGLLRASVDRQAEIDQLVDEALVARWPLGRIDPTLRALYRAATAEMLTTQTPPKVTITEFIDVAKAFFDAGKEARFVNGVLDHLARRVRPEAFAPRAGG